MSTVIHSLSPPKPGNGPVQLNPLLSEMNISTEETLLRL
jgi:hypothetical protein